MPLSNEAIIALVSVVVSLPPAVLIIWKLLQRRSHGRNTVGGTITIKFCDVFPLVMLIICHAGVENAHEQQRVSSSNIAMVIVVSATDFADTGAR
jgi:hypothetical protein